VRAVYELYTKVMRETDALGRRSDVFYYPGKGSELASNRKSAKEVAYDYISSLITNVDMRDGQFLTEEAVAQATGLSRTPVREALLRLEAEKLLQLVRNKGAFVPPLSDQEMDELMEARELLETFAADEAVVVAEVLCPRLVELIERQRQKMDELEENFELDRQFHQAIVEAVGNRVISQVYDSLRTRQLRMAARVVARSSPPERRMQQAISEHQAILEAIRSGDAREVRAAIRAHCRATLTAGRALRVA
jgi:DNA-binding GntR family transcriptional regulator